MASLSNAKTLGGVGGILALIPAISVIGWILIIVSMKEVSDNAHDKRIFDDALIGGVSAILSAVLIIVLFADGAAIGFINSVIGFKASFGPGGFLGASATFAVFYAFATVSGIFMKRAYDKATPNLRVGQLATAGLLYLVGALTSVLVVGFLIFYIAFIYQIIGYFSIQDQPQFIQYYGYPPPIPVPSQQPPQPQAIQPPQPATQPQGIPLPEQQSGSPVQPQATTVPQTQAVPTPQGPPITPQPTPPQFKFCFMCGTRLPAHAVYCSNCGSRQ
jgi:uncharacterized membrane protein